jgi:hypothetical protein
MSAVVNSSIRSFQVVVEPDVFTASVFVDVRVTALDGSGSVDPTYVDGNIRFEVEGVDFADPDVALP